MNADKIQVKSINAKDAKERRRKKGNRGKREIVALWKLISFILLPP